MQIYGTWVFLFVLRFPLTIWSLTVLQLWDLIHGRELFQYDVRRQWL